MIAGPSGGPPVSLEKRGFEQIKHRPIGPAWTDSCIPGTGFYRPSDGTWVPFECDSWGCRTHGPRKAWALRKAFVNVFARLGLADMISVTLDAGHRTGDPGEERTVLKVLWNKCATRLRSTAICASCRRMWSRGRRRQSCPYCGCPTWHLAMTQYVGVPEAHKDGTPHLHVATSLQGLAYHFRNDIAAVKHFLDAVWGAGVLDIRIGDDVEDTEHRARYVGKYLSKGQAIPPSWSRNVICTEDVSFRVRPWHRYFASREAARLIRAVLGVRERNTDPWTRETWILARPEVRLDGRVVAVPWNPAAGSAGIPACYEAGGHPIAPDWAPGWCHHDDGIWTWSLDLGRFIRCLCIPPWAAEPPWDPPIAVLVEDDGLPDLCVPACTCFKHQPRRSFGDLWNVGVGAGG